MFNAFDVSPGLDAYSYSALLASVIEVSKANGDDHHLPKLCFKHTGDANSRHKIRIVEQQARFDFSESYT